MCITGSPHCWWWSHGGSSSDLNCPCSLQRSTLLMLRHAAPFPAGGQSPHSRATRAWSAGSTLWPVHRPGGEGWGIKGQISSWKMLWSNAIILEKTNLLSLGFWHSKLIMTQQERPHLFTQRGVHTAKVDQTKQLLLLVCLKTRHISSVSICFLVNLWPFPHVSLKHPIVLQNNRINNMAACGQKHHSISNDKHMQEAQMGSTTGTDASPNCHCTCMCSSLFSTSRCKSRSKTFFSQLLLKQWSIAELSIYKVNLCPSILCHILIQICMGFMS